MHGSFNRMFSTNIVRLPFALWCYRDISGLTIAPEGKQHYIVFELQCALNLLCIFGLRKLHSSVIYAAEFTLQTVKADCGQEKIKILDEGNELLRLSHVLHIFFF